MALFQRRPDYGSRLSFTTFGMNKNLLIVGLGNPGNEYNGTRHNIGFTCLDSFASSQKFDPWAHKTDLKCLVTTQTLGDTRVILCKPTTFMNLSGEAVQAIAHFYKIPLEQIIVVHDELDIPFGQIRVRTGGSSAGHNGIKNISLHLSEHYGRVRIGIGPKTPPQIDSADFVLQRFSKSEQAHVPLITREVAALLSEYAYGMPVNTETRSFL